MFAIKMTLYRTGGDPRIIRRASSTPSTMASKSPPSSNCVRASMKPNNIQWTRQLEEKRRACRLWVWSGFKIHAKVALVVRGEQGQIRRYVHLATGNYNPTTARLYTDPRLAHLPS
ncbi:MAG: hypothetical protein WDM76_12185 [Limisphaerales bacterium]